MFMYQLQPPPPPLFFGSSQIGEVFLWLLHLNYYSLSYRIAYNKAEGR